MLPQTIMFIGTVSVFIVSNVLAKVFRIRALAAFWFCISILSIMMIITGWKNKDSIKPTTDKTYWSRDFTDYDDWATATWSQYAAVDHRIADSSSDFWQWIAWVYLTTCILYALAFLFYLKGNRRFIGLALLFQFIVSSIYFWPIADQIGFSAIAVVWILFPILAFSALDVFHLPRVGGDFFKKSRYTCDDDGHCAEDPNGYFGSQGDCEKSCKQPTKKAATAPVDTPATAAPVDTPKK